MEVNKTTIVDTKTIMKENISKSLKDICDDLEERGYDSISQIVAYLICGDPGYISSYKECRERILKFNREEILETMLVDFLKK